MILIDITQPINKIIQIRKIYRENKDVASRLAATYKENGYKLYKGRGVGRRNA